MSALIEKEIETKVVEKLRSVLEDIVTNGSVRVDGSWQVASTGDVKGADESDESVIVGVAVSSPSFDTWTVPVADVSVAIGVTVRREYAPTGYALAAVMEPIAGLLISLQKDSSEVAHALLSTDGFEADGVRLDAGEPPSFNAQANVWTVARSLTVRGTIK